MPLYKGKDVKVERSPFCGCMLGFYPIGDDQDLMDICVVSRTQEDDEKWYSQSHMHLDMTEYWFILEGEGQIVVGDETYDVEPGDLIVTPPLKPHSMHGNLKLLCFMAKYNKDGITHGNKCPMICTDVPYRDEPEKRPRPWVLFGVDTTKSIGNQETQH